MAYYNTCPLCVSNLDPGERCNCGDRKKEIVPEVERSGKDGEKHRRVESYGYICPFHRR